MMRKMGKKSAKTISILLAAVLCACVLCSCGKKNKNLLSDEEIASFEHTFSNIVVQGGDDGNELVIDEEGFIVSDDFVYVKNDQVNIKSEPSSDAQTLATVNYGLKLYRTGYKEDGWNRIYYEGEAAYVYSNSVTKMSIDTETAFSYSLAALNIVETQRQFYSYEDMCADLNDIKEQYPDAVQLNAIGLTEDNRTVFEIVLGNPEAEHCILVTAGMEACEYMTSLFTMKLVEYYAHYAGEGLYQGYSYKELFENCSIHIIPMLNPDGVTISQYFPEAVNNSIVVDNINSWFERDQSNGGTSLSLDNYVLFYYANAEGVDITRNFPYHWDEVVGSSAPSSVGYKGISAGCASETENVIWLIDRINPDVVINFRTSGDEITYDYGLTDEVYSKSYRYADLMSKIFVYTRDDSCFGKSYYGSLEGYAACIKEIPAMRIKIGSGDAPLSLNEYSSIWNSGRESLAALMVEIINNQ
ncbi:MAG: M14 family zinc carboxypeptidase [Lachnospiraceae bacterium]